MVSTNTYLVGKTTGKGKDTVLQLCKLVNIFRKKTYKFLSVEEVYVTLHETLGLI